MGGVWNVRWDPERIKALRELAAKDFTAKEIAKELNTTRNSVLGACNRHGISLALSEAKRKRARVNMMLTRVAKSTHKKVVKVKVEEANSNEGTSVYYVERLRALGVDKRIEELRANRLPWKAIAAMYNVSVPTVRSWALRLGTEFRTHKPRLTPEQVEYMLKAWNEYVSVEEIAKKIGRSYGVTRQIIRRYQLEGKIGHRDGARSIAVQRYGMDYRDPRSGKEMLEEAYALRLAEKTAEKTNFRQSYEERVIAALDRMAKNIEDGMNREEAIYRARHEGVTLEDIASCFGITRERVRQIVKRYGSAHGNNGIVHPDNRA